MNKHSIRCGLSAIAAVLILTGCATSSGVIEYDTSKLVMENSAQATVPVFIRSVTDERVFDEDNSDPSVPSIDGGSTELKDHAIARKRNSFGKALGKITLPQYQTVRVLSREAIESALMANGWKVIKDEKDVTAETKIVDVKITKFWSWFKPGFWQITLTSNIEVNLDKAPKTGKPLTVSGRYKEGFQAASGRNWRTVMHKAYDAFVSNLKEALGKPDK